MGHYEPSGSEEGHQPMGGNQKLRVKLAAAAEQEQRLQKHIVLLETKITSMTRQGVFDLEGAEQLRLLAQRIAEIHPPIEGGHWQPERCPAWKDEIVQILAAAAHWAMIERGMAEAAKC